MRCPSCGRHVTVSDKSYTCDCVTIPKTILKKSITPEIVHEILANRKTNEISGFISSRTGKSFSAKLTIKDKKVAFDFGKKPNLLKIRAHSIHSGSVSLSINGAVNKELSVSYGHVSSRMAECLGLITAVNYVKHHLKNVQPVSLDISLNNLDFSRYMLRERIPRNNELKSNIEHLFFLLQGFSSWQVVFKPVKRPKLKGSPQASFPVGVFPWLNVKITEHGQNLIVRLPESPDVKAQFTASINRAMLTDEGFVVPKTAKQALMAWLGSVKKAS